MSVERSDIVQITNENHHWFPALVVVDEVKSWGLQGYAFVLNNDPGPGGQAFIRLKREDFERVGRAVFSNGEPS